MPFPACKVQDVKTGWKEVRGKLTEKVSGKHDVYFVFANEKAEKRDLFGVDWMEVGR